MTKHWTTPFFGTVLICFALSGFASAAEESSSRPAPVPAVKPATDTSIVATPNTAALTPDQFKALLPAGNAQELHLQDFVALQKKGPVVIIDLRTRPAFEARHLKGSVNMPLTDLTEKTLPGVAPDKNVPVVLACEYSFAPTRMIAGTMQAYPVLKAQGYKDIYRLNLWNNPGGMQTSQVDMEKELVFEGTAVVKK